MRYRDRVPRVQVDAQRVVRFDHSVRSADGELFRKPVLLTCCQVAKVYHATPKYCNAIVFGRGVGIRIYSWGMMSSSCPQGIPKMSREVKLARAMSDTLEV